jgi:hypothetical protein
VAPEEWLNIFLKLQIESNDYDNYDITCGLDVMHGLDLYKIMPY